MTSNPTLRELIAAATPKWFRRKAGAVPITHNLRFDGVTVGRLDDADDAMKLDACVFRSGAPWNVGDYIIFESSRGQSSRYKLDRIHTPRDPGDQHFLYCTFAPRQSLNTLGGVKG